MGEPEIDLTHVLCNLIGAMNWGSLTKAFGNAHCTTIGLCALTWVESSEGRVALDEGPQVDGSKADLILAQDRLPLIAAEVEGQCPLHALEKFETYLAHDGYCRAGLCIIYPYYARGAQPNRIFKFLDNGETPDQDVAGFLTKAAEVSGHHPGKPLAVVLLRKKYLNDQGLLPQIALNHAEWYRGKVEHVEWRLYHGGGPVDPAPIWGKE
jgi:hypothetical protein